MYPTSFLELVGGKAPVTLEEANAYFAARTASEKWFLTPEADREKALVSSTQALSEYTYKGYVKDVDQPFPFPRIGEYLDERKGVYVSLDKLPEEYLTTLYDLALHKITNAPSRGSSVDTLSVGSITLSGIKQAPLMPTDLRARLKPLLGNSSKAAVWRAN